jgi:hypothetical protein
VVVVSVACGAVLAAAVGRLKGQQTRATRLFHGLQASLERGDVGLADRVDCSYGAVALLLGQGIDVVRRAPPRRAVDVRRGQRLGQAEHRIHGTKPKRPAWMDATT